MTSSSRHPNCDSTAMSPNPESTTVTPIVTKRSSRRWIIAISCCWINFFIFSLFRSAGVLYMALVHSMDVSYADASWPISLAGGIASITCLPAGFMSHYFTIRSIVTVGITVTSFGIAICYMLHASSGIGLVIFFLGIVQGKCPNVLNLEGH